MNLNNNKRIINRKNTVSGSKPDFLMYFLHGYGADGSDLFSLSDYFSSALDNASFIAPDAPYNCAMSTSGKEWFPIETIPSGAIAAANETPLNACFNCWPICIPTP